MISELPLSKGAVQDIVISISLTDSYTKSVGASGTKIVMAIETTADATDSPQSFTATTYADTPSYAPKL